jgi:hypothetical protein
MLRNIFSTQPRHKSSRLFHKRRAVRPVPSYLEDRQLLATWNWVTNGDGAWNVAANWVNPANNTHGIPAAGDTANIAYGGITVTVPASVTVDNVQCPSTLKITGGTFTVTNQAQNSNISTLVLSSSTGLTTTGGSTTINGGTIAGTVTATTPGTVYLDGTITANPGTTIAGTGLTDVTGGVLTLSTNITAPKQFEFDAGTINGTGTLTVSSAATFTWTGGTLNNTTTTIASGGTLSVTGANTKAMDTTNTLNLNGTTNLGGTGWFNIGGNAVVNNSGTFNMGAVQFTQGYLTPGTFNNTGTLNVNAGSGTAYVAGADPLNNSGTVNVNTGTFEIDGGGTETGSFNLTSGNQMTFGGGTTLLNNGVSLGGAGVYQIANLGTVVTAHTAISPANLGISGGTLNGTGAVTVGATFNWTGGTLDGNGGMLTVPVGATATLSGAVNRAVSDSYVLNLNGTTNMSGTGWLEDINSAVINNPGMFNMNGPELVGQNYIAPGIFNNTGTLNVAAGTGTAYFAYGVPLNNSGSVNVTSGALELDNGGAQSGTFSVASGTLLNLDGGTNQLGGSVSFGGSGHVNLTSGTISTAPAGSTLTVATGVFNWNGGTFSIPVGSTLTYSGTLGIVGSNDMIIGGGGTFDLVGTINQAGTGSLRLDGSGTTSTVLNIPAGSVYNLASNSGITNGVSDGGIVDNAGTIEKTAVNNSSTISASLNSSAAITVNTGTLVLAPVGGTNTGGTFTVATGAILDLTGGQSVSYGGTYTGSGAGQIQLNSGTLNAAGGANGVTFNFPTGLFVWKGGTINTANTNVTIPSTGKLQLAGNGGETLTGGGSLVVAGTATQFGLGNLSIQNNTTLSVTGTYNLSNDSGITQSGGGVLAIAASGTLQKTAQTSTSVISATVNNLGKVYSRSGNLNITGAITQLSGSTLTGGTWGAYGSATVQSQLTLGATTITTIGLAATVQLSGPNSSIVDLSGLASVQGSFQLLSAQSFTTKGNLADSGSIILSPGSTLAVQGNYTQTPTGKLTVQIGGTAASPICGTITATGTVTLAKTLAVTSTVTPPVTTVLTILNNLGNAAISGTFLGLPEGSVITVGTAKYTISYVGGPNHNSVTLTRTA